MPEDGVSDGLAFVRNALAHPGSEQGGGSHYKVWWYISKVYSMHFGKGIQECKYLSRLLERE